MFDTNDAITSATPVTPPERVPGELRILDRVAREVMPAVWAMGVTCSALRLPADLTRRERELLDAVERGLERIVRVLSAVHDLVLLEREGELPLDPVAADMLAISEDAVAQVREAGIADAVCFTHEGDGAGVWDPERLSQAISLLVECAASAAPVDDPEVRVHWKGGDGEVLLVVERSAGLDEAQVGIDLEWGGVLDGGSEDGVRSVVARAILLGHGGSLARFASPCAVAYVACLPRQHSERLN